MIQSRFGIGATLIGLLSCGQYTLLFQGIGTQAEALQFRDGYPVAILTAYLGMGHAFVDTAQAVSAMPAPAVEAASTEPAGVEAAGVEAAAVEAAAVEAAAVEAAAVEAPARKAAALEAAALEAAAMREAASANPHGKVVPVIWIIVAITRRRVVTGLIALTILIVIWIAAINGSIGL
jgi:hypothetical protein